MPVHVKRMSWKQTAKSCEASRPRTVQKSQSHRKRRGLDAHAEWAVTERGEGDVCAPLWLCFTPPVYKLTGGGGAEMTVLRYSKLTTVRQRLGERARAVPTHR